MTQEEDVLRQEIDDDGICTLTISRPSRMNTLNGPLVDALWRAFRELAYDPAVRVLILTAEGDRAFCAGADLKERATMSEADVRRRIDDYARCFSVIERCPKPTICAINGYAFGGGLELALTCDLRLMATETQVGLTELKLGIIPGAGGTQRLPRLIGAARAKELIFTGARIDHERAVSLGVVNHAVPRADLMAHARELATQMLGSAPIALAQAKLAIDQGLQMDLASGLALESRCYAVTIPTEDRLEGLAAFKEGRPPKFQGK